MAAYRRLDGLKSHLRADCLYTGISSGPNARFEYGRTENFTLPGPDRPWLSVVYVFAPPLPLLSLYGIILCDLNVPESDCSIFRYTSHVTTPCLHTKHLPTTPWQLTENAVYVTLWWILITPCCDLAGRRVGVGGGGGLQRRAT